MDLKNIKTPINTMKKKISITIDETLLKWVDKKVNTVEYSSRSHLIEVAVTKLKEAKGE